MIENLTSFQKEQLEKYYAFLVEYNQKVNLTAITEKDEIYIKHFYDSSLIQKVIDLNNIETLCDVGSGAGFPSIVLKILYPHLHVTIVDALDKRLTFLRQLANLLNLDNITLVHARAEDYAKTEARESFDLVTARAVARENILNELCIPLVKVGGYFISMKGKDYQEEINEGKSLKILKAKIEDIARFVLPGENAERYLIKIKHYSAVDKKYPRDFAKIKSKPL